MKAEQTIVIAWVTSEYAHDGVSYARDLGHLPRMVEKQVGNAATWALRGTAADLEKARAYAATIEGARVFVYPTTEQEPLACARRDVLPPAIDVRRVARQVIDGETALKFVHLAHRDAVRAQVKAFKRADRAEERREARCESRAARHAERDYE